MTTRSFWDRKLIVFVAGLIIDSPKMEINLERSVAGSAPSGEVVIHNLSRDREQRIYEREGPITVVGGYGNNVGILWEGKVTHVERVWERLTRLTKITTGGISVRSPAIINRSYDAGVAVLSSLVNVGLPISTIVADIAKDMGLTLGRVNLPFNPRVAYFQWSGSPARGLTALCRPYGISWYEENGSVHLSIEGAPLPRSTPSIVLTSYTGLIGLPTYTEKGASATALLLPQATLQGTVRLGSKTIRGLWEITALIHRGTNWLPGDFETELELRAA